jgi:GH43 family beta-xylosidase
LDGNWYVYVAASDGQNKNHLMWALRSATDDPFSQYTIQGPALHWRLSRDGETNRWAIDGTVLELDGKRYYLWSGWEDHRDIQWLYIAEMKDPLTIGKRVQDVRQ